MAPIDFGYKWPSVKQRGQLAQLASAACELGLLAIASSCLCGAALTLLVLGLPRQAIVCLREVLR